MQVQNLDSFARNCHISIGSVRLLGLAVEISAAPNQLSSILSTALSDEGHSRASSILNKALGCG